MGMMRLFDGIEEEGDGEGYWCEDRMMGCRREGNEVGDAVKR